LFTVGRQSGALPRLILCAALLALRGDGIGASTARPDSAEELTAPWQQQEIGETSLSGVAIESGGAIVVISAGNIGGLSDQFHYVYQPLNGDGEIVAQVTGLGGLDPWSQAGVMIRDGLTPTAAEVFVGATGGNGWVVQRRDASTSGNTETISGPAGNAPGWVRLVREGERISAYQSPDGVNWTLVSASTSPMPVTVYVGLAVSSHRPTMATGIFTDVAIRGISAGNQPPDLPTAPPFIPAPPPTPVPPAPSGSFGDWQQQEIGETSLPGVTIETGGAIVVISAGDIGGAADQFHYAYQPLNGDGEIVAQVAGLGGLDPWSHAGVMIRDGLTPTAAEVFVGATGGNGWVVQRRDASTSGSTETISGPVGNAPGWVRLVREGERISAYQSSDGVNWTLVRAWTSAMPFTVYVGLAVSSHRPTMATGIFTDVAVRGISGGTPTSRVPPTVSILSPIDGSAIQANQPVTISARADAPSGLVRNVTFFVNGAQAGTDSTAPYSATLGPLAPGTYQLSAVAIDDAGLSTNSTPITVTVSSLSLSSEPGIAITSPLAGATFTSPASVTISASPSASVAVSRMDFYSDGTLIGSDATSPYSFTWNTVGTGLHLLTAVATLTSGVAVNSLAVPVSVEAAVLEPTPATLMFTPSGDGAASVDYYIVEIYLAGGAMPVASKNLIVSASAADGEASTDVSDLVAALAPGSYVAVVTAYGPGGSTSSQPSPPFTK